MNIYLLLGIIPYALFLTPVFFHFRNKSTYRGDRIAWKITKIQKALILIQVAFSITGILKGLLKQ
jgi:hypothetical protein